ncbi:MFS transporter [Streptomyces sp. NPDC059373]
MALRRDLTPAIVLRVISPSAPARPIRLPAWAGRNFRLLTASAVVTNLGSSGSVIAAAFAVLQAGGSGTDIGLVAAARTLPLVVFMLIGGALADRLPRHHVMVGANLLNAASQAVFAVLVLSGSAHIWQMAALSAVGGTALAFFGPAAQGMVLATVDRAHAGRAFAVFRMASNGANIGGAALGGALTAAFGPGWVLAIDACSFLLGALLRTFLRVEEVVRSKRGSMVRDLRDGWREFVSRRWLWAIVVQFSVVNAATVATDAVFGPLVANDRLGGAGPWGVALAAFGVGNILGGLLLLRRRPRRILLAGTLCIFPWALPQIALAAAAPAPLLIAAMLVSGVTIEVFGVTWMLALQQEIPEEKLSRVSAYDGLGSFALIPVGTALAGPAADAFGLYGALWGCAALTVLLTAAVLLAPEVRRLTRNDGPPAAASPGTTAQPTLKAPPGGSGEGTAPLS